MPFTNEKGGGWKKRTKKRAQRSQRTIKIIRYINLRQKVRSAQPRGTNGRRQVGTIQGMEERKSKGQKEYSARFWTGSKKNSFREAAWWPKSHRRKNLAGPKARGAGSVCENRAVDRDCARRGKSEKPGIKNIQKIPGPCVPSRQVVIHVDNPRPWMKTILSASNPTKFQHLKGNDRNLKSVGKGGQRAQ